MNKNAIYKMKQVLDKIEKTKQDKEKKLKKSLQKIKNGTIHMFLKISKKDILKSPITEKKFQKFLKRQYKMQVPSKFIKFPVKKIQKTGQYEIKIFQEKINLKIEKLRNE